MSSRTPAPLTQGAWRRTVPAFAKTKRLAYSIQHIHDIADVLLVSQAFRGFLAI